MPAPAHAAPELVQLCKTEPLGIFDQHQGGVGNVYPDLDNAGADENVESATGKGRASRHPSRRL